MEFKYMMKPFNIEIFRIVSFVSSSRAVSVPPNSHRIAIIRTEENVATS